MWKLNKLSSEQEQQYLDIVLQKIMDSVTEKYPPLEPPIDEDYVKTLLLAMPNELLTIEDKFNTIFPITGRDKLLKNIFNYTSLLGGLNGFRLASLIGNNTCAYCNRSYNTTVNFEGKGIIRAQFDHWYDKKNHPLLALSLYNLIPCCSLCNGVWLKGKISVDLTNHVHPYAMANDETFTFKYIRLAIDKYAVLVDTDSQKVNTTMDVFKTREIYNSHSDYELRDMLHLRHVYNDNYLLVLTQSLGRNITFGNISEELLGVDPDPLKDLDRPLNKFRRDIHNQLENAQITP